MAYRCMMQGDTSGILKILLCVLRSAFFQNRFGLCRFSSLTARLLITSNQFFFIMVRHILKPIIEICVYFFVEAVSTYQLLPYQCQDIVNSDYTDIVLSILLIVHRLRPIFLPHSQKLFSKADYKKSAKLLLL